VDFKSGRVRVEWQHNQRTRQRSRPKNGKTRVAVLTPRGREALLSMARVSEFCFVAPRGGHYTLAARRAPWQRTREKVRYTDSLYLCSRHFCGWYMVNVLGLDSEDVAFALGHEDGGELVRRLYGHRSREQGLERVARAFEGRANVVPLTIAKETG
jgi:integrase